MDNFYPLLLLVVTRNTHTLYAQRLYSYSVVPFRSTVADPFLQKPQRKRLSLRSISGISTEVLSLDSAPDSERVRGSDQTGSAALQWVPSHLLATNNFSNLHPGEC